MNSMITFLKTKVYLSIILSTFTFLPLFSAPELVDVKYAEEQIAALEKKNADYNTEMTTLKNDIQTRQQNVDKWNLAIENGTKIRESSTKQLTSLDEQIALNKDLDTRVKLKQEYDALYDKRAKVQKKLYDLFNDVETNLFTIAQNRKKIGTLTYLIATNIKVIENYKKLIANQKNFGGGVDSELQGSQKLRSESDSFLSAQ